MKKRFTEDQIIGFLHELVKFGSAITTCLHYDWQPAYAKHIACLELLRGTE